MGLSKMDLLIAYGYASQLLRPLKYGENGVFFWIPGSGMTSIVQNLFSSKHVLKRNLSEFSKYLEAIPFWGHLSEQRSLHSLLNSSGFTDYTSLEQKVLKTVKTGKEVVCLVGRIDDYSDKEKITILKHFIRLTSNNRHRIHILFNSFDKPWFEQQLVKYPEFIVLANYMEIVPILSGKKLKGYIESLADDFDFNLTKIKLREITQTYGGIIQLTKEFIRSGGNSSLLGLKFRVNWQNFPKSYKLEIENFILEKTIRNQSSAYRDLKEFGALELKLFSVLRSLLNIDPNVILASLLTPSEKDLWNYLKLHRNREISKDSVIGLLRPENSDDVSFWAIDQAVSRFRKKLAKAGMDPEYLVTLKGKGYIWKG